MANYSENPPIGIDLGTTNSVLTYYAKTRNKSNIVEAYIFNTTGNTDNNQLFPSYVLYENDSIYDVKIKSDSIDDYRAYKTVL